MKEREGNFELVLEVSSFELLMNFSNSIQLCPIEPYDYQTARIYHIFVNTGVEYLNSKLGKLTNRVFIPHSRVPLLEINYAIW